MSTRTQIAAAIAGLVLIRTAPARADGGGTPAFARQTGLACSACHTTVLNTRTTVGFSLNNTPTVQDRCNSTPAWGFPYGSSAAVPNPAAAAMIDGTLGQQVAGLTAYTLWNDRVYGEFGFYFAAPVGAPRPLDATANDVLKPGAPYWRFALPHTWGRHYLSIGTYGMSSRLYPTGVAGPTNKFTDIGVDLASLLSLGHNSFTTDATWIHETQKWDAGGATNPTNTLNTYRFDAMYHVGSMYAFTLAPFTTTGTSDATLYAPAEVTSSRTGSPNSSGLIAEVDVMTCQT